jgi:hypothetical protein
VVTPATCATSWTVAAAKPRTASTRTAAWINWAWVRSRLPPPPAAASKAAARGAGNGGIDIATKL